MRLILARHGQTGSNVDRLLDTAAPGAVLTDLGHEQARALADLLGGEPLERILVSTLTRTQQTAAPLGARVGIELEVRDGLREIQAGAAEMHGDEASIQSYLEVVLRWSTGDLAVPMPGSETGEEFFGRFDAVVQEVDASGAQTALLVSHGAAIRCWTAARAVNLDPAEIGRRPLDNTGVVVLEGSVAGRWTATTWMGRELGADGRAVDHGGPTGEPMVEATVKPPA